MIRKDTNEYLEFLTQIKSMQNSKGFRAVFGIGKNGDILANSISGDLNVPVITEDDILLYRITEILIVTSEENDLMKKYKDYGYLAFVMK